MALMVKRDINHLPVVDTSSNVIDFLLHRDIAADDMPAISTVIMAGGFGTQLRPFTKHIPKLMLPVASARC